MRLGTEDFSCFVVKKNILTRLLEAFRTFFSSFSLLLNISSRFFMCYETVKTKNSEKTEEK